MSEKERNGLIKQRRLLREKCKEKDKEIERLNNIINELEKYLELEEIYWCKGWSNIYEDSLGNTRLVREDIFNEITKIKNKLQELKGSDK